MSGVGAFWANNNKRRKEAAAVAAKEHLPRASTGASIPSLGESPAQTAAAEAYPRDVGDVAVPALGESPEVGGDPVDAAATRARAGAETAAAVDDVDDEAESGGGSGLEKVGDVAGEISQAWFKKLANLPTPEEIDANTPLTY